MSENQKQSVEGWVERFDENWYVNGQNENEDKNSWYFQAIHKDDPANEIKHFISQLLSQQQLEVVETIKEMLKNPKHKIGEGGYCDTGADMEWACRSECTKLILDDILQSLSTLTTPTKEEKTV